MNLQHSHLATGMGEDRMSGPFNTTAAQNFLALLLRDISAILGPTHGESRH